jgi:hypothetical protein
MEERSMINKFRMDSERMWGGMPMKIFIETDQRLIDEKKIPIVTLKVETTTDKVAYRHIEFPANCLPYLQQLIEGYMKGPPKELE